MWLEFRRVLFRSYSIVLVLPYINMNLPWVYTCSPSWIPLPPPFPYHPSGLSLYTSFECPVSCIEPGLVFYFTYGNIHVSVLLSQIIPSWPFPTKSKSIWPGTEFKNCRLFRRLLFRDRWMSRIWSTCCYSQHWSISETVSWNLLMKGKPTLTLWEMFFTCNVQCLILKRW